MAIDGTIAVLYAQTGYTARVAHDATNGPQAALAMSRALAAEAAKLEQQQVQAMEPSVEARVADDNSGGNRQGRHFGSRRRSRPPPLSEEQEDPRPSDAPLVGNLLNIKV